MCIVGLIQAEGTPRPRWTFLHAPSQAVVIASRLQEPTAIYLWLLQPGSSVPVAVRLPWNEALAAQLQQATQDAAGMHGLPSMTTAHGKPMFGAGKIAPLPQKGKRTSDCYGRDGRRRACRFLSTETNAGLTLRRSKKTAGLKAFNATCAPRLRAAIALMPDDASALAEARAALHEARMQAIADDARVEMVCEDLAEARAEVETVREQAERLLGELSLGARVL